MILTFTAYCTPQPQGSAKAFVIGGKARITSANTKLKPFRSEVAACALQALDALGHNAMERGALFGKHVPVQLDVEYVFRRPPSIPKSRTQHVVKPDRDKLDRALGDALTGIVYHDDAQACHGSSRKVYGEMDCVRVTAKAVI